MKKTTKTGRRDWSGRNSWALPGSQCDGNGLTGNFEGSLNPDMDLVCSGGSRSSRRPSVPFAEPVADPRRPA